MGATKKLIIFIVLSLLGGAAYASPDIQHWQLKNGVRVYFVEAHAIPMVQLSLQMDAGSARDPKGENGVAVFTAGMLEEGAGKMNADDIARAFEDIGAEFGAGADRDKASISLRVLSDEAYLKSAAELFQKVLTKPTFPDKNLQREKKRMLVALQQKKQDPGSLAGEQFHRELFQDHPYAYPSSGDVDSVTSLTRDMLLKFYQSYYQGSNAALAIVGDLTRAQAEKLAEVVAGKLPKGEIKAELPEPVANKAPIKKVISFPSSQSHIFVGHLGVKRGDPDYFPLWVGNYILGGGGLVSRLSDRIREKEGLAYSVYSYFHPMKQYGPFIMGLQTKNESRDKALRLLMEELERYVKEGPTDEELIAAKKHLTGSFPLRIDSNKKITGYIGMIGYYQLPLTYLDDLVANMSAVTREQIRDAFKRRIKPENMVTIIVGGKQ